MVQIEIITYQTIIFYSAVSFFTLLAVFILCAGATRWLFINASFLKKSVAFGSAALLNNSF